MGRTRRANYTFKRRVMGRDGHYDVQIGFGLVEGPHPYLYVVDKEVVKAKAVRIRVGSRVANKGRSSLPRPTSPSKGRKVSKA